MLAIPFQSHRASLVYYPPMLNDSDCIRLVFVLVLNTADLMDQMLKWETEKVNYFRFHWWKRFEKRILDRFITSWGIWNSTLLTSLVDGCAIGSGRYDWRNWMLWRSRSRWTRWNAVVLWFRKWHTCNWNENAFLLVFFFHFGPFLIRLPLGWVFPACELWCGEYGGPILPGGTYEFK